MIEGDGLWSPPADVVAQAQAAASEAQQRFESHPGPLDNLPQNLLVIAILAGPPDRARLARVELARPDARRPIGSG